MSIFGSGMEQNTSEPFTGQGMIPGAGVLGQHHLSMCGRLAGVCTLIHFLLNHPGQTKAK